MADSLMILFRMVIAVNFESFMGHDACKLINVWQFSI